MGNNQSTQRKDEAGSSFFAICCGSRPQSPDGRSSHDAPGAEHGLRNAQGVVGQPMPRPSMSMADSGQEASQSQPLQHKHSMSSTVHARPPTRHRSDASKFGRPSTDAKQRGLRKTKHDQSRSQSTELPPLELPKLLPQQKRLSPLPDFASFWPSEMGDLSQQPWVAVRTMAERMPSRRSSVLTAQENAIAEESKQRLASISGRSTSRSPMFDPTSPRLRSPLSVSEIKKLESTERAGTPPTRGLERSKSTPSPGMHSKPFAEPKKINSVPKPEPRIKQPPPIAFVRTVSDLERASPVPKTLPGPARSESPHLTQRKPSQSNTIPTLVRKSSLTIPHRKPSVEVAVREIQDFVEAKREITNLPAPLQRTDSTAKRLEEAKKHRPAIAPGMVVGGSSELLDDIGSAFSRSTSETPMVSQHRNDGPRTPGSSHPPSSFPKRLPRWIQGRNSEEGSPRHSGTFFVTRHSRNNSTNEDQTVARPIALAPKRDESPVDKHWTPVTSDLPSVASTSISDVDKVNPIAVPEKDSVKPSEQPSSLISRRKRSSTIATSNPVAHLSVITGSEASSPAESRKSHISQSVGTTPTTATSTSPARVSSRSQSRSRADKSLAVQAARTRALTRAQSHEAMSGSGLGLGIEGLGRAKDDMILNIVDLDKLQPQPRSSSLRKKRDRSSSTIANPSDSPLDTLVTSPPPQVRHIAAQQVARAVVVPASGPETEAKDKPRVIVRQLSSAKQQQKEKALAGHGVNIVRPSRTSSIIPAVTDVTKGGKVPAATDKPRTSTVGEIVVTTPPPRPIAHTKPKGERQEAPSIASPVTKADKPTGYRTRTHSRTQSLSKTVPTPAPTGPVAPPMPRKPVPAKLPKQPDGEAKTDRPVHIRTKSQPQPDNIQVRRRPVHSRTKSTPHDAEPKTAASTDSGTATALPLPPAGDADAAEQQSRGRALSQSRRGRPRTPQHRQRSQPARVTSMSPEERQSRERETKKREFEMDVKRSASARRLREVEAELRRVEGELAQLGFGIGGGKAGEGGAGVGVAF